MSQKSIYIVGTVAIILILIGGLRMCGKKPVNSEEIDRLESIIQQQKDSMSVSEARLAAQNERNREIEEQAQEDRAESASKIQELIAQNARRQRQIFELQNGGTVSTEDGLTCLTDEQVKEINIRKAKCDSVQVDLDNEKKITKGLRASLFLAESDKDNCVDMINTLASQKNLLEDENSELLWRSARLSKKRFGLGVQAGYNPLSQKPYIGVGVSYNIIRF